MFTRELRETRLSAEAQALESSAQLERITEDLDIMVPPDNTRLFTILSQGVGVAESAVFSGTATSVAPGAAFATDLVTTPFNQQTNATTQEIWIQNNDRTASPGERLLCYKPIAWASAGATCALKCANIVASFTCTSGGTSTDGLQLGPGAGVQRRYDGTSCICVVASAAATNFQSERVIR